MAPSKTPEDAPTDGREAALLALYRGLKPREQRAFEDALHRHVDGGQPIDEAMEEFLVRCSVPCAEARKLIREVLADQDRRWRSALN